MSNCRRMLEERLPRIKDQHRARQGVEELGFNASSRKKSELRDRGCGTFMLSAQRIGLEHQFLNVNCLNRNKICAEPPEGMPTLPRELFCSQQPFYLICISAFIYTSVAAQSYFLKAKMKAFHSSLLKMTINAEQCCFSFGEKKTQHTNRMFNIIGYHTEYTRVK